MLKGDRDKEKPVVTGTDAAFNKTKRRKSET